MLPQALQSELVSESPPLVYLNIFFPEGRQGTDICRHTAPAPDVKLPVPGDGRTDEHPLDLTGRPGPDRGAAP